MDTKQCAKCKSSLPIEMFYKRRASKDGLMFICKKCDDDKKKQDRINNPEKTIQKRKRYYSKNKDKVLEKQKLYASKNREKERNRAAKWRMDPENAKRFKQWRLDNAEILKYNTALWVKNNAAMVNARCARRRASLFNAIPKWANKEEIRLVYAESRMRRKQDGQDWTVDHIVPLKSDIVCGLHVQGNLRVITRSENAMKNNKWWPDMP